jgi:Flp pilus assembly protein TadG
VEDDRGTVLLEFCLVLPLLFICIWGILAFTLHAIESQMLHFAAFVAARTALLDSDPKTGQDTAANFLAISRKEPTWASQTTRKLTGRELSVNKKQGRVEVEIGRDVSFLGQFLDLIGGRGRRKGFLGNLDRAFARQRVHYAMGRPR